MAVTAKAFYNDNVKNAMLAGLTVHGFGVYNPINKVAAKTTSGLGLGSFNDDITWATASGGSVAKSDTPVINVTAGHTINYLELHWFDTTLTDYVPALVFTISAESFPYAGSITITAATLSVSSTIL